MDENILNKYHRWLKEKNLLSHDHLELEKIKDNEEEIISRFGSDLTFGTGGLRGVMGVGTNRMNIYTVRRATQGLANYLNKKYQKKPKCAIAYDTRNNSKTFAYEAARVLGKNKIKVYLFEDIAPTPVLSFAVRYLKCEAGIVITASHNPKQYNGYKCYGYDGAQMANESANEVMEEIEQLDMFKNIKVGDFDTLMYNGYIEFIDDDLWTAYRKSTLANSLSKEERNLHIVYTPLHGTGLKPVTNVLREDGFFSVEIVQEQKTPDGNFPTAPYPNPEFKEALQLGIEKYLILHGLDIMLATDPDADRVGVVVNQNNTPVILTGNEVGILLFNWIYQMRKENNKLPANPTIIKTIVSSDMANIMAKKMGVNVIEVLTGFKFIGEQMLYLEEANNLDDYLFGFEESCGYLTNKDVRDKDSVNACLLIAEMANYYKNRRKTLVDQMNTLYEEYGHFLTKTLNYELDGIEGKEKILEAMKIFRLEKTRSEFGQLEAYADYLESKKYENDHVEEIKLPKSDVVKYFFINNDTITFRPSGTEPKLKAYIFSSDEKRLNQYVSLIDNIMNNL